MANSETALGALLDREAIREVLLRYARGVDRRDLEVVASCFIPGAAYEGVLGTGTIETALAALPARLERYASTMHFIGNQAIEVESAGHTAKSETYCIASHRLAADDSLLIVGVRYLDDFVREDRDWHIARRVVTREWQLG